MSPVAQSLLVFWSSGFSVVLALMGRQMIINNQEKSIDKGTLFFACIFMIMIASFWWVFAAAALYMHVRGMIDELK